LCLWLFSDANIQDFQNSSLRQFNYHFENDFIFQTDKYYTHGNKLEWIFQNNASKTIYNFNFKQSMYTPAHHSISYVEYKDMPYTGVAEFELGVHKQSQKEQLSVDASLGYTGAYTYAQESMELIHSLLPTNPQFNGWSTQRGAELLYRVASTYKRKVVLKDSLDIIFDASANIGNLRSYATGGFQIRFGEGIENDFGLHSAYSNSLNYKNLDSKEQKNIYFLFGANSRYIYNDLTLEGNGVKMLHFQGALNVGFSSQYKSLNFSFLTTLESRRFHSQDRAYFGYADITIGWQY
jgi:lipid A 3-O-deacylase